MHCLTRGTISVRNSFIAGNAITLTLTDADAMSRRQACRLPELSPCEVDGRRSLGAGRPDFLTSAVHAYGDLARDVMLLAIQTA